MMHRHGVLGLLASAMALAAAAGGCSLIVSGDVPDFQCTGASASSCPSGMICNASGRCVTDPGVDLDAGDELAPDEDVVEAGGEADAPSGPLDNGQKCRVDADCKSRLCGSSTILTTTITSGTGPICTTPCCTSTECASGFVCFNGGTGGGYCVPAALAQRPATTGSKIGGSPCALDSECRSGLCTGSPKACLDTCCVDANCGGTAICRVKNVAAPGPSHDIWVCAPPEPGGTKLPGAQCADSSECMSDTCIGVATTSRVCRPSCSNTASCRQISGFASGHCLYGPSGSDFIKFCYVGTTNSDDPAGAPCAGDNGTCQSTYCDAELKKCANVCGRDADCLPNETCRPSAVGTPYLRCVPKP